MKTMNHQSLLPNPSPMPHPLEQKIVALRRDVRQMAVLYGMCIVSMALLGMIVAWGLLDYLFRFQDRGLRIIASLSVLGVYGWTLYRCVLVMLWRRLSNTALALRVQRQFPQLGDRLVSAIEFLHATEDDPTAGSAALRRAVVDQATAEAKPLNFASVFDWRPLIRVSMMVCVVGIAVSLLVVLNPSASGIAVTRLVHPLGNTAWPRANHLAIRQPATRVARGRAFQIEVIDALGARLPPEVRIHYRFDGADARAVEETEPMQYVDGAMTTRRDNVLRPFSYRVEGGDDQSMPWLDVQVVEPPAVESLSVRLIPPAYTGWSPTPAERHIRALAGTRVQIAGKTAQPLRSAVLCLEEETKVPARLGDDGCTFTVDFTVEKSGSYWFELTDREGLRGGDNDRWEIRAVPDSPPTVSIEQPTANLFVTPQAVVSIRVAAVDDLAVRDVALLFRRPDSEQEKLPSPGTDRRLVGRGAGGEGSSEEQLPLWASAVVSRHNLLPEGAEGDRRVVDYRWDLGPLELKPGTQVTFHATAADYLPQTGKSDPRSFSVITAEELQNRIAGREKIILAELERALRIERGCRVQVESLGARLAEPRPLGRAEVDQLQAVEHNQREADQVLTSRGEGVLMHILALLAELENNRLQSDDAQPRMSALLEEIDRLGQQRLPVIGRELSAAVKTGQVALEGQGGATRSDGKIAASLAAAGKHQDAVIVSIERMIGQLARWDSYRTFPREIGQLLRDQEDAARRTSELGRRTLTQELRDLSPQDVADLKAVAGRQLELARLLDRILQKMAQAGGELRENDPSTASTIAGALDQARRLGVSGQMRSAGQRIQRNQIGQAAAGQKQIGRDLREVLDILTAANQSEPTISRTPTGAAQPKPSTSDGQPSGEGPDISGSPRPAGDGKVHKPDMDEMRAVMKRLWGELPEHARQQMLQSPVEEFPPKYELLIEQYFRKLAEEKGK